MTDPSTVGTVQTPRRSDSRPRVLVVTGMSGAGRSTAAKVLEDLGYTVVDNLPPQLIPSVIEHHRILELGGWLAVVVDSRGGMPTGALKSALRELEQQGVRALVLFLDAENGALIRRYEENRRPHPMKRGSLQESIMSERQIMEEARSLSDTVIDTTELNVHELRDRLTDEFSAGTPERPMRVSVTSFGFKHGIPRGADLLFDVRFLPNPHWVPELRPKRGTDPEVAEYVLSSEDARDFVEKMEDMLEFLIPRFGAEGKSYLSIGIGCTGGHHRSVAIAEAIGGWLEDRDIDAVVRHRDVDR